MSKRKLVKSSVDTGTPPASSIKAQKLKDLIISGEALPDEEDQEIIYEDEDLPEVKEPTAHESVKLEHSLYEISFKALDVSVSEHQVAIKIPNSSMFRFEPKVDSKFNIVYRKKSYNAIYLGGIFTFSSDNTWAITFILNKDD